MNNRSALMLVLVFLVVASFPACGDEEGETANNGAANNGETNNGETNNGETNNGTPVNDTRSPWQYLLLDDYTPVPEGTHEPGADIDAIGLIKSSDGSTRWVIKVVESNLGRVNNDHLDTMEAIGAPDAECEDRGYISIGGVDQINYLVVRFGSDAGDSPIESGDQVVIEEVGLHSCPDGEYTDEAVEVSVSVSNSRQTWIAVGTWVPGAEPLTVP